MRILPLYVRRQSKPGIKDCRFNICNLIEQALIGVMLLISIVEDLHKLGSLLTYLNCMGFTCGRRVKDKKTKKWIEIFEGCITLGRPRRELPKCFSSKAHILVHRNM